MFWNKRRKGYIIIYTLLISSICLVISTYLFTVEQMKLKNNKLLINSIIRTK